MPSTDRVAVLGLGGGGAGIVAKLGAVAEAQRFDLAVADTDSRTFETLRGVLQIPVGGEWDCALGCGGDVQLGERAAAASADAIRQFIQGARLLIVVVGLGGGTGSGAANVVARLAKDTGVTTFFVATLPFAFEGNWRRQQAVNALTPLRDVSDAVVVVQNDLMFTALSADTPAKHAFEQADEVLAKAIQGLGGIVWADWMIRTDFAAIQAILRQYPAACHLGIGVGTGEDRCREAVESFLACPLIGGPETLARADAAVITLQTGNTVSVGELQACLNALQQYFSDQAHVLIGACASAAIGDSVQLTGLICQQDVQQQEETATAEHVDELPVMRTSTPSKRRRKTGHQPPGTAVQGELPLQEQSLGIFSGTTPTMLRGENLDVPTFQRRGIHVDTGD